MKFTMSKVGAAGEIDRMVEQLVEAANDRPHVADNNRRAILLSVSIAGTGYMGGIAVCCLFEVM